MGAGSANFVRPVHWLVLLFGEEVIDAELLGVKAGRATRGHRFHRPDPMELATPAEYLQRLESEGHVIADFQRRKTLVREQVEQAARAANAVPVIDSDLLDEVTALVEWPVPVVGRFDERFLDVPSEALISSMQEHQKYFPLRDQSGALLPSFIAIANIDSRNPESVKAGNERVIRPRLADAAFFWNQDRKQALETRLNGLKNVVYQTKLGSVYEKSRRVASLASAVAEVLGLNAAQAERAAWLGRCDLATEMVGEFPELQGIMGRYYALHDGEPVAVADALDEQYMPRFAGDAIAPSALGKVLAVAERADTLVAIFAVGKAPSGDKDPFALRRAALGLLRTLIEGDIDLDLAWLLEQAALHLPSALNPDQQANAVYDFCLERLRYYYQGQGYAAELFDAVAACRPTRPVDFHRRISACREFVTLPEASSLAAANKRIRNILRKNEAPLPDKVDPKLLQDSQEQTLAAAVQKVGGEVRPLLDNRDYTMALAKLAALREPVDEFFEHVLVMAEDPSIQGNRLRLLSDISTLFMETADVSRLPS
nr:glycine--tRNA ligase subunit beta [Alkalilimnicola ehrlichii]